MAVLCVAGLALTGSHLLVGFLLTPFFGDGPFLWANVFAALILSLLGGGLLDSSRIQRFVDRKHLPVTFLFLGSLFLGLTPLYLASFTRSVLDSAPDSYFTALGALSLLLVLPGSFLSGTMLAMFRCGTKQQQTKIDRTLVLFLLGGAVGVLVALPPLMSPEVPAVIVLGTLSWLPLAACAVSFEGWKRFGTLATTFVLVSLVLFAPGELESLEYRTALGRAFKRKVGRYYIATAGRRVLGNTDVRKHYESILKDLEGKQDPAAAALIMVLETLKNLGSVELSGESLADTLRHLISAEARRYVMAFLDPLDKISSDGRGRLSFHIKPSFKGKTFHVPLAAKEGEKVFNFVFEEDFTLALSQKSVLTELRVEPEVIEKAGFFELNETHKTPVKIQDVTLFVDAHLLGATIENKSDRVIIKVRAQGSLGPVVNDVLHVIEK